MELSEHELRALCASADRNDRLRGLRHMRDVLELNEPPKCFFDLAASMVGDEDNDCRWQALIVVSEFIPTDPDKVWMVVRKYGDSDDEDMRDGVSSVVLEHLLGHDFERYFASVKSAIDQGALNLLDTLARCWPFDQAEPHTPDVVRYLEESGLDMTGWHLFLSRAKKRGQGKRE